MSFIPQRHFWVVNLMTIVLCAFFSAKAIGRYVEARMVNSGTHQGTRSPTRRLPLAQVESTPPREIAAILERNIFCSACEKVTEQAAGPAVDPGVQSDGRPVRSTLGLKLLGTITSEENPLWNYAFLLDPESNRTNIYGVGAKLAPGAEVTDILDRAIFILNNGRTEYLSLAGGAGGAAGGVAAGEESEPPKYRMPEPAEGLGSIARGIRRVGGTKYEIERGVLDRMLASTSMLAQSSRIVPAIEDGQTIGFRIFSSVGSLPSLLGLFSGDTVVAINGNPLTNSDQALNLFTQLRTSSYITLTFNRQGAPITHEYVIR
jgi:general secretion pathway protein C